MTDPYWRSIDGLGEKRAKVLGEKLGIRSLAALHASAVDEIVEAINETGSQVTAEKVQAWLQAARAQLKAETASKWDELVRSVRISQGGAGSTRTVEVGSALAAPLSSTESFTIELDLTGTRRDRPELALSLIASEKTTLVLYRPDRTSGAQRWLVPRAERGLYRLGLRADDGSIVKGPVVQTV